jgi:hypothetical protein
VADVTAKLLEVLSAAFPGSTTEDLERAPGSDRITGLLVWDGFADLDPADRQSMLWRNLRQGLAEADLREVGLLFTVTPDELVALHEE